MVCFKFLHPKFSNNTNKHKLKSNLQKLEFSKHLVQIAWGLTLASPGSVFTTSPFPSPDPVAPAFCSPFCPQPVRARAMTMNSAVNVIPKFLFFFMFHPSLSYGSEEDIYNMPH